MEELLTEIQRIMSEKGLTSVDLPTYEWNPTDREPDDGNGAYLIRSKSNFDRSEFWNLYIRRVHLKDGRLTFDLQEVYEDTHDNYEELNWYTSQSLEDFDESLITSALKNVKWVVNSL